MSAALNLIPAVRWLKRYDRRDLPADLIAGLIVAVMLVPQGMAAYTLLAEPGSADFITLAALLALTAQRRHYALRLGRG